MKLQKNGVQYDMTVSDVAREFEYSTEYVRFLARKGDLPYIKLRSQYRFNREQVEDSLINLSEEKDKNPVIGGALRVHTKTVKNQVSSQEESEQDDFGSDEEDIIFGI